MRLPYAVLYDGVRCRTRVCVCHSERHVALQLRSWASSTSGSAVNRFLVGDRRRSGYRCDALDEWSAELQKSSEELQVLIEDPPPQHKLPSTTAAREDARRSRCLLAALSFVAAASARVLANGQGMEMAAPPAPPADARMTTSSSAHSRRTHCRRRAQATMI